MKKCKRCSKEELDKYNKDYKDIIITGGLMETQMHTVCEDCIQSLYNWLLHFNLDESLSVGMGANE